MFLGLPPGSYRVRAMALGYTVAEQQVDVPRDGFAAVTFANARPKERASGAGERRFTERIHVLLR